MRSAEFGMRSEGQRMKRVWVAIVAFAFLMQIAAADDEFLGRTGQQWSAALTEGSPQQRLQAAWALANLAGRAPGGPADNEQFADLVKLIHDSDASVRYWGAIGLTNFGLQLKAGDGGRSGVINALAPLLEDKSAAPRIAAAAGLGKLGQPDKALPVLVTAMQDPQDATRIQAVAALEALGDAAAPAEATLVAAQSDASEYVKRISARALGKLKSAAPAK